MICAEWWAFEIMAFVAARFGTISLASHAAVASMSNLFFMIPLGII